MKFLWTILGCAVLLLPFSTATATELTNSIGMKFILVPAGTFLMGSQEHEEVSSNEKPLHRVEISKPFYLSKYEVTQSQWLAVTGINPGNFRSPERPVDEVSWNDVQLFLEKLNKLEKTETYRLPTEAEWEYAARAGSETVYYYGDDPSADKLKEYAWFADNSGKQTNPAGQLKPNAWGLHDMYGNVAEWVQDRYDRNYYGGSPSIDPQGPKTGKKRVVRGGSWLSPPYSCRSAVRGYYSADYTDSDFGFRLVKETE